LPATCWAIIAAAAMAPACEPSGRRVGVGSATARQVHDGSGAWRAITAAMAATIITFKQACLLRSLFRRSQ